MRKAIPEVGEPQLVVSEDQELARVIPIRTETTLTRLPFHRIAKKGDVKIKQTRRNERGKVETTWEVKNPPGPLSYKLDTIIINRRIDEMRNRGEIQQLLKIGSLRDICDELGINASGKNTNAIKDALRENAFAGITAKIEFAGVDGTERTFEFNTTRYTVIFTGEKLPGGKRANAVYIELHPRYHDMLKHSKTRPLDYEYLKELPPSAQRLYELLSFAMFGALKYGRPNAQMFYSEFCQSAPLTRYTEWDKVRPQMWKIHKPHIEAGYIKSVEFEETTDSNGVIDWLMKYTPGRKARHEYREFTTKRIENQPSKPRLVSSVEQASKQDVKQATNLSSKQENLLASLLAFNVGKEKARELIEKYPDRVERELEAFPHRDRSKMIDPAAWLIGAIEKGNYSQPLKVEEKRAKRAAEKAAMEKKQAEEARERHRVRFLPQYLKRATEELARIEQEHPQAFSNFSEFVAEERANAERLKLSKLRIQECIAYHADWFFNDGFWQKYQIPFLTFWEWDERENPHRFRPPEQGSADTRTNEELTPVQIG